MNKITLDSSEPEKLFALSHIRAAIGSLKALEDIGLSSASSIQYLEDLIIFERQLNESLWKP